MPHAVTTNKAADAISYVSGVQAMLDTERHKLSVHMQWMPWV